MLDFANNFKAVLIMKYIFLLAFFLLMNMSFGQVLIKKDGTENTTPDPSAILELRSDSLGLLLPRFSSANLPTSPPQGLLYFDTTMKCMRLWNGTVWQDVTSCTQPSSYTITISDAVAVVEGEQQIFIVNVSPSVGVGDEFTLNYESAGNTATEGMDYVASSGSLTFVAGDTSKQIILNTTDDEDEEPLESYTMSISSGSIVSGSFVLDISDDMATAGLIDNDSYSISIAAATDVVEGNSQIFTVSVMPEVAMDHEFTVTYHTTGGTATQGVDYTAASGTLTFEAGQSTQDITVTTTDDADEESSESYSVAISAGNVISGSFGLTLSSNSAVGTIHDNDSPLLSNERVVLAYFPSWSENWVAANQDSKLRRVPNFVNYIFLAFAKPNLRYVKGSYDIGETGIGVPYDGCTLKESVSALKDKGIKVILSIGGETYWGTPAAYNIEYQQIKDLVDDMGFTGIDWDFEPNGSFANIGSDTNVQHFIDFFNNSRAIMPRDEGYILACAPSGVGALGGSTNDDVSSPYAYANRNTLTGEDDTNLFNGSAVTNGINLFGFTATGHMIPVMEAVGNKIDLIAFQGYNAGGSTNRSIMYDAFAYYAEQYGFTIAAGTHYPPEPWGPHYTYTHNTVASLASHIMNYPDRIDEKDGVMIWQLLLDGTNSSAYSYMNVASQVFGGATTTAAINNATTFSLSPYEGGAEGCSGTGGGSSYCGIPEYNAAISYPTANTEVYHVCKIWRNKWYANPGEEPGSNAVWEEVNTCSEGPNCQ